LPIEGSGFFVFFALSWVATMLAGSVVENCLRQVCAWTAPMQEFHSQKTLCCAATN
jgi:hypothetical protein